MYGIELVESKQLKEPLSDAIMSKIASACKDKGLLIGVDKNIIRLNPPLVSREEDLHFLVDTFLSTLNEFNN